MVVKPGMQLRSTVSSVEVVVVRAPAGDIELTCGGSPMVPSADVPPGTGDADGTEGPALGKRYADEESGLELLCTKAGAGQLALDGSVLAVKGAKPLPSSD